jgi:hypothetical protein
MKTITLNRLFIRGGILLVLVFSGTVSASRGQKIDPKHPSVYITFGEFVKKTADIVYPSEGARLVLHNNTDWPIYFSKDYDPTAGEASIIYIVEMADGRRDVRKHVDVVMRNNKLMPGKNLSFVVPRTDFPTGSEIYVEFNFSWELAQGEIVRHEAVHRAYFLASCLPAWPKQ